MGTRWGAVLACSVLKQAYRDIFRGGAEGCVRFIWLDARPETIMARIRARSGHFMPPELLSSQVDVFEPPTTALRICFDDMPEPVSEHVVEAVLRRMASCICKNVAVCECC